MSSNPVISSPSSFSNMSWAELDLVAQAAAGSGFNPYDILYGSPPNINSPPLGPRNSVRVASDLLFEAQFWPSIPPTPSPTPRRRQRQPASLLNLAREQVRAQGINPMEFMARPLREAGRRGGVEPIVIPPYTPPSLIPSSLEFSSPRSSSSSRRRRGQGRGRGQGRRPPLLDPSGVGQTAAGRRGGRRQRRRWWWWWWWW